jgi:lipopolysaccharide export system permease protein
LFVSRILNRPEAAERPRSPVFFRVSPNLRFPLCSVVPHMASLNLKLVDRYIFKQMLDYFLLGVVVFTLIAFFSDTLLKFIREIQKYGIPLSTLLTMVGLQLPRSVALVLPASAFLAVLMVFNQLNNQFEIIALRMNGISLWRLMVAPLVLGVCCSATTYWLNDYVVPWCSIKTDQMKEQVMRTGSLPSNGNSFMYRTYDAHHNLIQLIYVSKYQGRELGDSTIVDLSKPDRMQVLQSRSGVWDPEQGWDLHNVNAYIVSRDQDHSSAGHFGSFVVNGLLNNSEAEEKAQEEIRRKAQGIDINSDQQTFSELWQVIERRQAMGKAVSNNAYLKLWDKITYPLSCVVIILGAVPLALTPPRQNSNRGFTFAIIILFLYYQLDSIFNAMGHLNFYDFGGALTRPDYLALLSWAPLFVMAIIGLMLIRRKSQVL